MDRPTIEGVDEMRREHFEGSKRLLRELAEARSALATARAAAIEEAARVAIETAKDHAATYKADDKVSEAARVAASNSGYWIERGIRALATSPPREGTAEGWVLVPREPTDAMLANTVDARGTIRILDFTTPEERGEAFLMPRFAWRAMLAAAPPPPQDAGGPGHE